MPRAERVSIRRPVLLLAFAWPLSLHSAILFAAPEWPARVNAVAAALALLIWASADRRPATAIIASGLVALLAGIALQAPEILLYAPPVVINAALAIFFGASLRPGREPVISLFARLEQGVLPPDLARHARLVTGLWTLLLAVMATIAIALALWAPLETWSLFTNVVSYTLIAALFLGEYVYRRVHFRQYRHASLATLLRNVRSVNLFGRR